jgi:hypothetical protein
MHAAPPHELSATLTGSETSLRALAGLGREFWHELDVPTYIDELRRNGERAKTWTPASSPISWRR